MFLVQLRSVMMSMVSVTSGGIGTMCVEYEVCAELSLPFTGPGIAVPAPHWTLQQNIASSQETWPHSSPWLWESWPQTAWAYEVWLIPSL